MLPMYGMCISFNLSVAMAILLATLDARELLQAGLAPRQARELQIRWLLQAQRCFEGLLTAGSAS